MVMRKMIVGMVVVLVLLNGQVWATQYYVSPDGNDDANGLSWETAFATIGKGITDANDGDIVDVNEGTYYETIDFAGKAIEVRGTDPIDWGVVAATIIDANNPGADAVMFDDNEDANSVLRGLTVMGASVGVYVDSVGPVISRCILHSNRTGVKYTKNSTGTLIVNNKIHDSNGYGVFGQKGDATIKSNWIYDSDKGIKLASGASADIYNNTIVNNISYGIDKGGGQGVATISNCIIWNCNDDLEGCSATYSCISDCNDASGTGNICGDGNDPNFVDADANDFHIEKDSPCLDAGDPCYAPDSSERDIDGNYRVHGTAVDMGADEDPADWYVDGSIETSGDGRPTWGDAFKYLQDALAAAKSEDEIWVAEGVYNPDEDTANPTGTGDRTATFQLVNGVAIYGGYAGISDTTAQRDIHKYETILSGDIDGDGVLDDDNSYHVVKFVQGSAGAVLDGFTITGGSTDADAGWEDWPDRCGGGVFCWEVSGVTIKNCLIIDNKARYNRYHGYGGGVFNYKSSVTVENCFFINNTGDKGGGMANKECSETVTVTNCVFSGNHATRDGGGIYNRVSHQELINCTFSKNHAESGSGGGVQDMFYSNTTVTNCIFWGNTGYAGYYIQPMQLIMDDSSVVKYSCIQDEDPADPTPFGGGDPSYNIDDDPRFVDADNPAGPDGIFGTFDDGLRVRPDSPCVDSGDSNVVITEDIIGNSRIVDGDRSGGDPEVDMGAYELPKIWYVDQGGNDTDGKSWANAFKYPRDALNNSINTGLAAGDEIWVAEGTYYADQDRANPAPNGSNLRTDTFQLSVSGVFVRGGYAGGGATDPYDQDFGAYETILSGDIDGDNTLNDWNSHHVVTGTDGATFEGFTITEGFAYGYAENNYGGGIYCNSASPTISSCVIKGNYSDRDGGGIYCKDNASPKIRNCKITGNKAVDGGGIYCENSSPVINNCKIIGNKASSGGGIYCNNASPKIINCTIASNVSYGSADKGGGGIFCYDSSPTIRNCVISGNYTELGLGGGMFNESNSDSIPTAPTVTNCFFIGNVGQRGGGISNIGSKLKASPTVINCVFSKNSASSYGGGIANELMAHSTLINCTFSGNLAVRGGGLSNYNSGALSDVTNCIFWGNYASDGYQYNEISYGEGADEPNVNYCDVKGGGFIGLGNINSDPYFIYADDPVGADHVFGTWDDGLRIMAYSPCVDKASDAAADFPETDITGRGRIDVPYTENDESPADMGAYESPIVWFVDDDASNAGGRDGRSWKEAEAFKYPRDALDDSVNTYLAAGDEIWVAGGTTYYADQNTANPAPDGTDSRNDTFQLVEGVDVYGGFAGEMTGSQRSDPTAYETILSGDIDGDPFDVDNDNSYHVVTGAYNAKLDGFTIKGGNANGSSPDNWGGGGIYCSGVSPTISNCVIRDNKAGSYGGGLCIYNPASPMVRNCFFIDNIAPYGGAMYEELCYVTVENCVFSGNDSSQNGGGIHNDESFSTLINCTFSKNHAEGSGGGMYNNNYRTWQSIVTNCIFWGNSDSGGEDESAQITGGAVVNYSCIQGGWTGGGGTGNKNTNPLFVGVPVSYWKFDEGEGTTAYDSVGNNDGILTNMDPTNWVVGKIGGALDFDGVDDFVDVGDPLDDSLDFGTSTDFTISIWFETSSANEQMIVNKRTSGTYDAGYEVYMNGGKIYAKIADGSSSVSESTTQTFNDGINWHHLVVVYDRDDVMTIYVDGLNKASKSISGILDVNTGQAFTIGARNEAGQYAYFNGKIDDVMIFDRALSPGEIEKLFERGSNGKAYDLAAGPDGIFGTLYDGLRLMVDSPCISAADGDAAPSTDILGLRRYKEAADIGAYEFPPRVVVMCWIDESSPYHGGGGDFNGDLNNYQALINSLEGDVVKSGCLVPLPAGEGGFRTIKGVLPENFFPGDPPPSVSVEDPPEGISIYEFPRTPTTSRDDFISHFERICEGVVPDYLCLSVDNSGSMTTDTIEPHYSQEPGDNFIDWLKTNYPNTIRKRRDVEVLKEFENELWVDEMGIQVQSVIDDL